VRAWAGDLARVTALLALVDLVHVAAHAPGALAWPGVGGLLALHVAAAAALLLATASVGWLGAWRRSRWAPAAGALGCAGLAFEVASQHGAGPLTALAALLAGAGAGGALLVLASWRPAPWALGAAGCLAVAAGVATTSSVPWDSTRPRPDAAPAAHPNVVVITIDTLRADHLGAYGYPRDTSPTLDAVAAEGTLFEWAFAQAPSTKPSTASLLTGTFPSTHGATRERARVPVEARLLAEHLRGAGYVTRMWSSNPWVTPVFGFAQGADRFWTAYDEHLVRVTLLPPLLRRLNALIDPDTHAYDTGKRLLQRLTVGQPSNAQRDAMLVASVESALRSGLREPFHLYLHLMSPHHPYRPPPPFDRIFERPSVEPPVVMPPSKRYEIGSRGAPLAPDRLRDMVARYDGGIRWADTLLARLLDALRSHRVLDRTLVVITSDHGEEFHDHGNWGHGQSLYNELLRVPLIVRYPPAVPAGRRVHDPVMSIDVVPTILGLAEIAHAPLPGRALFPLESASAAETFSEIRYSFQWGYAVVADGFKLIEASVRGRQRRWLYSMSHDAAEQHDLLASTSTSARHRVVADALARRASALAARARARRALRGDTAIPPALRDELRALGYLE